MFWVALDVAVLQTKLCSFGNLVLKKTTSQGITNLFIPFVYLLPIVYIYMLPLVCNRSYTYIVNRDLVVLSQKLVAFWNPEVMGVTLLPENLSYLENHFLTLLKGQEPVLWVAMSTDQLLIFSMIIDLPIEIYGYPAPSSYFLVGLGSGINKYSYQVL